MTSAFGSRLRQARQAAGWSLRELAGRVHYNTGYLSKIENGLRPASVELAKRCDEELGTGGALVELVPRVLPKSNRPTPRQLPAHDPRVVGRVDDLRALDRTLDSDRMTIAVISGTAGVGKTTLALHWAHRIQSRFPDGQLYAGMRGFGPQAPLDTGRVLRGFLQDLGVAPQAVPAEADERAAMFRSLLAGRRILVMLDNVRDSEHARPLLPGSSTCAVIITSRDRLDGLVAATGAHRRCLDLFTVATSKELLATRLGERSVAAEPHAAAELAKFAAGLPLALSVLASRINPAFRTPLQDLVDDLQTTRLDGLNGGDDLDLRTVFSWSCQRLSAGGARLFRLLGVYPGPDIGMHAAAALTGTDLGRARRDIAELVRAHMLAEHRPGRFGCHDLLRVYATEQAQQDEPAAERRAAVSRVLDHFLFSAVAGDRHLYGSQSGIELDVPVAGARPRDLADYGKAVRWFEEEHQVLMACVQHAADDGWDVHAWQLPRVLEGYLRLRGHWQDWVHAQHIGLAIAERAGSEAAQADAHRSLAQVYYSLCEYGQTEIHAERAIELYGKVGDRAGEALAHRHLAWAYQDKTDYQRAMFHHRQALALFRWSRHGLGEASSLNGLGWTTAHLGDYHAALGLCRQALSLAEKTGDRHLQAAIHDSLGYVHHRLGAPGEASANYRIAIDAFRELGSSYYEALSLNNLGDVQLDELDTESATRSWRAAKAILDCLNHPRAAEVAAKLER
ncbi:helix-turn-helix domain-containing protein [Actinocrispum wychmicini]|uniref:Tetratricopeptide (TPR) repeat protein n=1 Tax=Actinocrispum wychmicini TaxID=1213861 RepID=A0A4R2K2E2_9PSEU|nr:helix-turn-helix domain-containing protein [Actinocrispum wychmicini]TCO65892.1 tetratricopeptide (TPR) repeat protein [Actinocrispum wychmicini]